MRTCVIFNPAARGGKARRFRRHLDAIAVQCALKTTTAAGEARRLAAEAVADGFGLIVAAGGDGTVNEVLNGIGDAPDGFERTRLGLLPLGSVNVFARELGLPPGIQSAWDLLRRGREQRIDLPCADFAADNRPQRRYFVQLAGAGFDARAIELASWPLKKKIGPLAYVVAGLKALREAKPEISVRTGEIGTGGELVLVGNGRYYGGPFAIFPGADLRDGLLEVSVLPRVHWRALLRGAPSLLARRQLPKTLTRRFRVAVLKLSGEASFELDGEWAGKLPATFSVARQGLRVIVP